MVELKTNGKITWLDIPEWQRHRGFVHAFSTRLGGVSPHPYRGLNLGLKTADDMANVRANRSLFMGEFGISTDEAVSLSFVHSNEVAYIGEEDRGTGFLSVDSSSAEADGMITQAERCALFLTFADCPPVLFFDPIHRAIGACHAGWRGTLAGIAAKTARAMQLYFESDPARLEVVIGPCIAQEAFEVSTEVIEEVMTHSGDWMDLLKQSSNGERALFDIRRALTWQLEAAGVLPTNIGHVDLCTFARQDLFFSHRRSAGETGRMGAFIMLDSQR